MCLQIAVEAVLNYKKRIDIDFLCCFHFFGLAFLADLECTQVINYLSKTYVVSKCCDKLSIQLMARASWIVLRIA